jgi:hypothetical protein
MHDAHLLLGSPTLFRLILFDHDGSKRRHAVDNT